MVWDWLAGAQGVFVLGGLTMIARQESRLNSLEKLVDERDEKLTGRLERIEGKLDALKTTADWTARRWPQP